EVYDAHYHCHPTVPPQRDYEWILCVGGSAIVYTNATLRVTFERSKVEGGKVEGGLALPPPTDFTASTFNLQPSTSQPTAVMPSDEEIRAMKGTVFKKMPWMTPWQWEHIRQLSTLSKSIRGGDLDSGDPELYRAEMARLLAEPLRRFFGWEVCQFLMVWYLYKDLLPEPVQDYIKQYWVVELMPDRPTSAFGHMQQAGWDGRNKYYEETKDWRGNISFYRGAYTRGVSTMGFNHQAIIGALLGGAIADEVTDATYALEDGRYGLEHLILRVWNGGGTSQQSMEFCYLPTSLMPQKMFADFGATSFDRLSGKLIVWRTVDEMAAAYHPALRRIVYPIGRTPLGGMLVYNSGLTHVMHTLSEKGALFPDDLHTNKIDGLNVIDIDGLPDGHAYLSLGGPWMPQWCTNMVDEKIIPAMATVDGDEGIKRNYLGHHYGLASTLRAGEYQVAPVMAQWKFAEGQARSARDVRSFTLNYWQNESWVRHQYNRRMETINTMQQGNTMIVMMSPKNLQTDSSTNVTALLGSIAFFSFETNEVDTAGGRTSPFAAAHEDVRPPNTPSWKVYVDGQPITELPFACKQGQRITIHDGVTYLGIIPIPATDLGRDREVVLEAPKDCLSHQETYAVPMFISTYNMATNVPLDQATADYATLYEAVAGFVIEMGDVEEWGSFENFHAAFMASPLETGWDHGTKTYSLSFKNRTGLFEAEYLPAQWRFGSMKVDGKYPYSAPGVKRDTDYSQIGDNGRLEKNGATLLSEKGQMTWLQTDPKSGAFAMCNILPDMNLLRLDAGLLRRDAPRNDDGKIMIMPNGRMSMMRVDVEPNEGANGTVSVHYGFRPDQRMRDAATAILVSGFEGSPSVIINDVAFDGTLATTEFEGAKAFVIPLDGVQAFKSIDQAADAMDALKNHEAIREQAAKSRIQRWAVIGPFSDEANKRIDVPYPPETSFDVTQSVDGMPWIAVGAKNTPEYGPAPINLMQYVSTSHWVTAYAATTVIAEREMPVTLYLESEGMISAWFNGEKVVDVDDLWYRIFGQHRELRADVTLKQGVNTVLLKVTRRDVNPWGNGERGWGFSCRIGDPFGRPLSDGIRIAIPGGVPDPVGERAATAAPYTVVDTRTLSVFGQLVAELGTNVVTSVFRTTLPETGWSKAFYLDPSDPAFYAGRFAAQWEYPIAMTNGAIVFTAYNVAGRDDIPDANNLIWVTDAFGKPICRSFFRSALGAPDGRYSDTPAATLRFTGEAAKRYRLCVTGVSHFSDGGMRPMPDAPLSIAVVPAGTHPKTAAAKAEAAFTLHHGGNYRDYATLETVIDGDCDIYVFGQNDRAYPIASLFGAFLEPLP
ncbi:MAG: hypothetical protein FWF84_04185, partial [Kiritimatiellaeota bacterium]|nr:hypothetical protein [Kiritimatiellota bacterium]